MIGLTNGYPCTRYDGRVRRSLVPLIGVSPKGRLVYAVMGGNGDTDPPAPPPDEKRFTQAELENAARRALDDGKRQGRQAQEQAVQEALGCTLDEAKEIVQKAKDADTAAMSEAQKREKDAADREAAAEAREKQAAAKERAALIRSELVTAGAGAGIEDATQRAAIIADAAKLVDVAEDADEAAIRTAVEAVKSRHAGMFSAPSKSGMPSVPPTGGPAKQTNQPKSLAEIAREKGWVQEKQPA